MDIEKLIRRRLSAGLASNNPVAVILIGPIGVGKTTHRKSHLGNGYVHIDSADIFHELSAGDATLDFPGAFSREIEYAGRSITQLALQGRLNVVIETPGHESDKLIELINLVKAVGYTPEIIALDADRETCELRHARRGDSVSSYWAAPIHVGWVIAECHALGAA